MEQSTKLLGGISYIVLIVFGILEAAASPFLGIISLIAAICVLVAFFRAGDEVGRPEVKRDITIAIVIYIVAMILLFFVFGAGAAAVARNGSAGFGAIGAGAIAVGVIGWILSIIAAWFWFKASSALTEASGTSLFKIGGLLLFIGAILLIVFGIGAIVMWVGEILQAIAFFTTPERGSVAARDVP